MWRLFRLPISKHKFSSHSIKKFQRPYSSSSSSGGKFIVSLFAATGAGFAGAVVYGKYDSKFKKMLKENVPYIDHVYKWLDQDQQKSSIPVKTSSDEKNKDPIISNLLKKKLDREKASATELHNPTDPKTSGHATQKSANENLLDMITKLQTSFEETKIAYEDAFKSVKQHTKTLYEALDLAEGKDGDVVWKDVNKANSAKNIALRTVEEKASCTRDIMERLKVNMKIIYQQDKNNPIVKRAEESVHKVAQQLEKAEAEVTTVETEAKTATEYQKLVSSSREQFQRELEIILPNYVYGNKDKMLTENDLNMLISHAHRRIEQLQKQLARQQVTEKVRVDEAVLLQKLKDQKLTESKVEAELGKRHIDLESAVSDRVASLKDKFETELRQQLHRQAAAHADHIQEVMKMQEQEIEKKFNLDLEEKLLHQKGVFISEVSGNMARLKGILAFLRAKSEFDKASKKAQALWLACQAMSYRITEDNAGNPYPLGKDIAAVKIAADEDSEFISCVLASIPLKAVNRGVYNKEVLKERFQKVKKVCRRVALIDENNDSLYRYFLSYLQSVLIIDVVAIPKEELEGKIAINTSEWDTFDIIGRISYCLGTNDLEQALRYANQLKGEPKVVAKDWMNEVRLLLETELAMKALLAHAAAIGVQAYH